MPRPNINLESHFPAGYSYVVYNDGYQVESGGASFGSQLSLHRIDRTNESHVTPNFRNYKRFGNALPKHNYSYSFLVMSDPATVFTTENRDGSYRSVQTVYCNTSQALGHFTQDLSAYPDDPAQKAVSRLIEQIGTAKADLGTSIAELGKTADHVSRSATRIFNALRALKRGRFGDFANALGVSYSSREVVKYRRRWVRADNFDKKNPTYKEISKRLSRERHKSRVTDLAADTWLEYTYGWKPLLQDVYSSAEALASVLVDRQGVIRTCSASANDTKNTVRKGVINIEADYSLNISVKSGVKYKLWFRIPTANIPTLHAFGLSNPLTVAWEIVPFSFVVDWFLPIGDALSSLSAYNGLEFATGEIYRKTAYTAERKVHYHSYQSGSTFVSAGTTLTANFYSFDRTRRGISSFPTYGWPRFKDPRSLSHGASAIALLQSIFLRK